MIEPVTLASPASAGGFFRTSTTWEVSWYRKETVKWMLLQEIPQASLTLVQAVDRQVAVQAKHKSFTVLYRRILSCYTLIGMKLAIRYPHWSRITLFSRCFLKPGFLYKFFGGDTSNFFKKNLVKLHRKTCFNMLLWVVQKTTLCLPVWTQMKHLLVVNSLCHRNVCPKPTRKIKLVLLVRIQTARKYT